MEDGCILENCCTSTKVLRWKMNPEALYNIFDFFSPVILDGKINAEESINMN